MRWESEPSLRSHSMHNRPFQRWVFLRKRLYRSKPKKKNCTCNVSKIAFHSNKIQTCSAITRSVCGLEIWSTHMPVRGAPRCCRKVLSYPEWVNGLTVTAFAPRLRHVYHRRGDGLIFCDLDPDLMTLMYELDLKIPKCMPKMNFLDQGFQKLEHYKWTDGRTQMRRNAWLRRICEWQ